MNEIREIVTKTVIGKGKKLIRLEESILPVNEPFSILGCWIINHDFSATLTDNLVNLEGTFEVNIWYAYDNNTKTDIAKENIGYQTEIKIKQKIKDLNNECRDVIVRMLQQPTCTNACIQDEKIVVDIILEVIAEVIGEAKMVVAVLSPVDNCEPIDDDFENEINENFMNVN